MGDEPESAPLPDARRENFARAVASGSSATTAYLQSGFAAANKNSAGVLASRMRREAAVRDRIDFLKVEMAREGPMDRAAKLAVLEDIIRRGRDDLRVKAVAEHTRLSGDGGPPTLQIDPARLANQARLALAATQGVLQRSGEVIVCVTAGSWRSSGTGETAEAALAEAVRNSERSKGP